MVCQFKDKTMPISARATNSNCIQLKLVRFVSLISQVQMLKLSRFPATRFCGFFLPSTSCLYIFYDLQWLLHHLILGVRIIGFLWSWRQRLMALQDHYSNEEECRNLERLQGFKCYKVYRVYSKYTYASLL